MVSVTSETTERSDQPDGLIQRLGDIITITRFPSVMAGGAEALLGAYLAAGKLSESVALAAAAMAFSVAAAMVLNDIADIEVDAVAKAGRPLPSGRWSVRSAWFLTSLLGSLAVVCAARIGLAFALGTAALLAVSALYSYRLKSTVVAGNVVVALCATVPVVLGAFAGGSPGPRVGAAAGLVFGFMFAYEITKTISDGKSDAQSNVRTIATACPPQVPLKLLHVVVAVLALAAFGSAAVSGHPRAYLGMVAAFLVPTLYAVRTLARRDDPAAVAQSVLAMRIAWVIGSLTLWFLR